MFKRGVLANLAVASFGHLVQVIRHGLKKIQSQPGLIEGCLSRTGPAPDVRTQRTSRIKDLLVRPRLHAKTTTDSPDDPGPAAITGQQMSDPSTVYSCIAALGSDIRIWLICR